MSVRDLELDSPRSQQLVLAAHFPGSQTDRRAVVETIASERWRVMMAIYQSMQRVRFSSPDGYDKFKTVFADVRTHLKNVPGFLHLTWWIHPQDPTWHNEISLWTSMEALRDWHMNPYHKAAKEWAVRSGAIMEDIIANFELKSTRLLRICPCCGQGLDKVYDLNQEQKALAEPCVKCGFHFPMMPETSDSSAVFKDVAL